MFLVLSYLVHLYLLFAYPCFERFVVVGTVGQSAVDEAHQFDVSLEAQFVVVGAVDVLSEDVAQSLFAQVDARDEFIVAPQRSFKLQVHASHDGVGALLVHLGKTESALLQEQVSCVFCVMQLVGIVDDALDVTFIVANHHFGGKYVIFHCLFVCWMIHPCVLGMLM